MECLPLFGLGTIIDGNGNPIPLELSYYQDEFEAKFPISPSRGPFRNMNEQTEQSSRLFAGIDFLTLAGAIVTLFVALGTESWWTLTGTTNSKLFNIQVSPFYVHISAVGLPTTVPLAGALGSLTRTVLLLGFLALFAASIRPTSWWRNLAVYFGVSALAELYLSFVLMFYWTETAFLNTYGILPPYLGTTNLQTNMVGLDLTLYSTPLVTATFGIPYYLGFISMGLIFGRTIVRLLHERASQALAALLPGSSIKTVYFRPPYRQVWFSSEDQQFNPLKADPATQTDDELLVSFTKLYEKVEPGGDLDIIIPPSASTLSDRLEKIIPQTGFKVETTGKVDRTTDSVENELRFRKPTVLASLVTREITVSDDSGTAEPISHSPTPISPTVEVGAAILTEPPPISDTAQEPKWAEPRMTRLEKSILKAAVKILTERQLPVTYRELLNQVYMELVDHKVEFDSARQIEATLLSHSGGEVQLIEEEDDAGLPVVKKWALGNQKLKADTHLGMPSLDVVKDAGTKLPHLGKLFKRRKRSRYRSKSSGEDDSSS